MARPRTATATATAALALTVGIVRSTTRTHDGARIHGYVDAVGHSERGACGLGDAKRDRAALRQGDASSGHGVRAEQMNTCSVCSVCSIAHSSR